MAKKIKTSVKLVLTAGKANPAPPVGPALGQHGINIAAFCKDYNGRTAHQTGLIIPVKIIIYDDKSYSFVLKSSPTSVLLATAANIKKGSAEPNKKIVGTVTHDDIEKIVTLKMNDLNTTNQKAIRSMILGTARNMGIKII